MSDSIRWHSKGEVIVKKTLSFGVVHMGVAFTIGYTMSGDLSVGGALALVEPVCNTVAFYVHEKIWLRLSATAPASTAGWESA